MSDNAQGMLVIDVEGHQLTAREKTLLTHPVVAGVILFARNFASREQLTDLVAAIRQENPTLLIMADQEGGRVQRFRGDGFSVVPPMGRFGHLWESAPEKALMLLKDTGWLLASELRATGFDLGLSPVLDLDRGISRVIGDRGFSSDPAVVTELAGAFIDGLHQGGMAAVGKHFPGHGGVGADSHIALPVDRRSQAEIQTDIEPYAALFSTEVSKGLDAIMPAHVCFPACDGQPAGFSHYWLKTVLRDQMGFQGAVFSDCLSMAGASVGGGIVERFEKTLAAGCDAGLVCNFCDGVDQVVAAYDHGALSHLADQGERGRRLKRMAGFSDISWRSLLSSDRRAALLESYQTLV